MKITHTEIWKYSIPMHPFRIATGTMNYAQNLFIRIHTDTGRYGVGECSAFPMIVGETQATCFEMARDFALLWKNKDAGPISERLRELDAYTAYNSTAKSAFDMALFDLAAKSAGLPLYQFLGGKRIRKMETDLTIGIDTPEAMAEKAVAYVLKGVSIIKIKLGTSPEEDIERVRKIRLAVGQHIRLRTDANQGWNYEEAVLALDGMAPYSIEFCEQPMRHWYDDLLPLLIARSPVPIMADESVFNHYDALRLIKQKACNYINIKFAKSGGIAEAIRIHDVCREHQIPCMMGGMLESRVALTAFAHFATAHEQISFFDMDTCMLGHTTDPVTGGVTFNGFQLNLPDSTGIGADVEESFLSNCEKITI